MPFGFGWDNAYGQVPFGFGWDTGTMHIAGQVPFGFGWDSAYGRSSALRVRLGQRYVRNLIQWSTLPIAMAKNGVAEPTGT